MRDDRTSRVAIPQGRSATSRLLVISAATTLVQVVPGLVEALRSRTRRCGH